MDVTGKKGVRRQIVFEESLLGARHLRHVGEGAVGLFNKEKGLLFGHGFGQLGSHIVGVLAYSIFSALTAWILWSILGTLYRGIRVTEPEEQEGLDSTEHGMEAYPEFITSSK